MPFAYGPVLHCCLPDPFELHDHPMPPLLTEQEFNRVSTAAEADPSSPRSDEHAPMPTVEARIDQMLRDAAELKSQVFHLRTDVARSSSSLKRTMIVTGVGIVLAILLGIAGFGSSPLPGMNEAPESGKPAQKATPETAAKPELAAKPEVAAQPEVAAKPVARMNCANLPADIKTSAVDFSIQFPLGSAKISSASEATLDNVAKMLALAPDRCVLVEGYSDVTGNAEKNMALSKDRANSVVNYIAAKAGIERNRLVPMGKGSSSSAPGFDPSDPQNRRVIFQVVTGPALAVR